MMPARLVLAAAAAAGVAATVIACRPTALDTFFDPTIALLAVAALATATCLIHPHTATWSVAAVGLLLAAAIRLGGAVDPEWDRALLAAAGLLTASESLHLVVRSKRWPATSILDGAILRLGMSIALRGSMALGATAALIIAWSLTLQMALPPVVADSLERWSGWALAVLLTAAVAVVWLLVSRWRAPRAARAATVAPTTRLARPTPPLEN